MSMSVFEDEVSFLIEAMKQGWKIKNCGNGRYTLTMNVMVSESTTSPSCIYKTRVAKNK